MGRQGQDGDPCRPVALPLRYSPAWGMPSGQTELGTRLYSRLPASGSSADDPALPPNPTGERQGLRVHRADGAVASVASGPAFLASISTSDSETSASASAGIEPTSRVAPGSSDGVAP